MEEVASLAQRFASRIEAIRPLQLPRFPGPPPVGSIPKTRPATATGTSSTPTGSMPRITGSPMTEASDGQTQPLRPLSNNSPSGAADELPALPQTGIPQQGAGPDLSSGAAAGAKSTVPRLDLAAVHGASPVEGAAGRLSGGAKAWMSQYQDPGQLEDEMVRQQHYLETGRVKIEGQVDSVNDMVEDWEEAVSPAQASQPVQNALQV